MRWIVSIVAMILWLGAMPGRCAAAAPTTAATPVPVSASATVSAPTTVSAPATPSPTDHGAGYSADALYNEANAYARSGKVGLAVLDYERAHLLAPGDQDIAHNLAFVRASAKLPAHDPNWLERSAGRIDPLLAAWLGAVEFILAGGALIARYGVPNHRGKLACVSLAGIALVAVTVANAVALYPLTRSAVVITNSTTARVSPVPMGDPLFTLGEGEFVRLEAQHEDFLLVRTLAGRSGWVTRGTVVPVVPPQR